MQGGKPLPKRLGLPDAADADAAIQVFFLWGSSCVEAGGLAHGMH